MKVLSAILSVVRIFVSHFSLLCLTMPVILPQFVTVVLAAGPAAVPLGSAGTFAILAKAAVSTVPPSSIGV